MPVWNGDGVPDFDSLSENKKYGFFFLAFWLLAALCIFIYLSSKHPDWYSAVTGRKAATDVSLMGPSEVRRPVTVSPPNVRKYSSNVPVPVSIDKSKGMASSPRQNSKPSEKYTATVGSATVSQKAYNSGNNRRQTEQSGISSTKTPSVSSGYVPSNGVRNRPATTQTSKAIPERRNISGAGNIKAQGPFESMRSKSPQQAPRVSSAYAPPKVQNNRPVTAPASKAIPERRNFSGSDNIKGKNASGSFGKRSRQQSYRVASAKVPPEDMKRKTSQPMKPENKEKVHKLASEMYIPPSWDE